MARRLWLLVPLAAAVALLALLRGEEPPPRAPPRPRLLEGETLRDLPVVAEEGPEREPVLLAGRVFGPDGAPAPRAEVRVVFPKTYELVRAGADGAYELPFDRSGRFLVEAALTTEYAPERAWVEVPEEGAPAPQDFHLKAAGAIFGEVTLGGVPAADAGVEIFAIDVMGGEEPVYDTGVRNGYFNFHFEPPRDVPLRLTAFSDEGFLRTPVRLVYRGGQLNAGRLDLVPYPALRIRMRLPDGSYAEEVSIVRPEDLGVDAERRRHVLYRWLPDARMVVPEEGDVTRRILIGGMDVGADRDPAENPFYLVEREVQLAVGTPRELEVLVRPGPLAVTARLLDGDGRPIAARIAHGEEEVATGDDGSFRVVVPHGGLVTIWLAALQVPGFGWIALDPGADEHALLLDADDPGAACRLDLRGRVLALAAIATIVELRGPGRWSFYPPGLPGATVGRLSPRLPPGEYTWNRHVARTDARGRTTFDPPSGSGTVTIGEGGLAVLDAR
jgi:hypothetical protein